MGVGLAFAIFVDATIIRGVLLPATNEDPRRLQLVSAALAAVDSGARHRGRSTPKERKGRGFGGALPEPAAA